MTKTAQRRAQIATRKKKFRVPVTKYEAKAIRVALPSLDAGCWHFGLRDSSDPGRRAIFAALAVLKRIADLNPAVA